MLRAGGFPRLLSTAVKGSTRWKGLLRVSTAPSREVTKSVEVLEEAGACYLVAVTGIEPVLSALRGKLALFSGLH
jgi:hypothetical protein